MDDSMERERIDRESKDAVRSFLDSGLKKIPPRTYSRKLTKEELEHLLEQWSGESKKDNRSFSEQRSRESKKDNRTLFEKYAGEKSNIFLGLLGAIIGDLLGAFLIILMNTKGWWSAFPTIFIYFFVLIGYVWLGKGMDVRGLVLCVLVSFPTFLVAHQVGWTLWFMNEVYEAFGLKMNFMEILPNFVSSIKGTKVAFTYYIDTLLAIFIYILTVCGVVKEEYKKIV